MKKINLFIGNEYRDFYFGLGFLGNLLEKEGLMVHQIDEKIKENPFKWVPLIMFYSATFAYTRKNENAPFDAFDVSEWIDGLEPNSTVIVDFFEAFRNSLQKDVPMQPEEQTKKKVTKK